MFLKIKILILNFKYQLLKKNIYVNYSIIYWARRWRGKSCFNSFMSL